MPDQTLLEAVLTAACAFAVAHSVDPAIRPHDFGIQRSGAGVTVATYVDADHAVTVTVNRDSSHTIGVAELHWTHNQTDNDRDICDYCEIVDPRTFTARPVTDIHLPGDTPPQPPSPPRPREPAMTVSIQDQLNINAIDARSMRLAVEREHLRQG